MNELWQINDGLKILLRYGGTLRNMYDHTIYVQIPKTLPQGEECNLTDMRWSKTEYKGRIVWRWERSFQPADKKGGSIHT